LLPWLPLTSWPCFCHFGCGSAALSSLWLICLYYCG